jgi:uncharacterized membrane protein YjgN (DUF898 family)
MKNYFDFQLNGRKLFPLWMIFYVIVLIPYVFMIFKLQSFKHIEPGTKPSFGFLFLMIPIFLGAMVWSFYFIKLVIENIGLNERNIECNFRIGKFIGLICLGMFLSIITLGIYSPWFMRDLQRFFVDNSSYKGNNFSFSGKGIALFLIITLTVWIPVILLVVVMMVYFRGQLTNPTSTFKVMQQLIMQIMLIPYIYFVYKWAVNFNYREYQIRWNTRFWPSIGKILLEIALSIITFGIYLPLAFLRLYAYFSERTGSNIVDNQSIKFGYDLEGWKDFTFVWGQTLLSIITLGIYYPWAFSKIGQRVLGKTYMEKTEI